MATKNPPSKDQKIKLAIKYFRKIFDTATQDNLGSTDKRFFICDQAARGMLLMGDHSATEELYGQLELLFSEPYLGQTSQDQT